MAYHYHSNHLDHFPLHSYLPSKTNPHEYPHLSLGSDWHIVPWLVYRRFHVRMEIPHNNSNESHHFCAIEAFGCVLILLALLKNFSPDELEVFLVFLIDGIYIWLCFVLKDETEAKHNALYGSNKS